VRVLAESLWRLRPRAGSQQIAGPIHTTRTSETCPVSTGSHFAFGENWASFARLIDETTIDEAQRALLKLVPHGELEGRSFLDIGCGSGLHSLAAMRLGVAQLTAVDIDPISVHTTIAVLQRQAGAARWSAEVASVFDLSPSRIGRFDIVYSWGVLHHTGDMRNAVRKAAALVNEGGLFAFALYRSTRMDAFWVREKRIYAHASARMQRLIRRVYVGLYRVAFLAQGRSFSRGVTDYRSGRGMHFDHDVHDWLGGYPYETILASDVARLMADLGFREERIFSGPMTRGLLGSSCDEYVYRRCR
jgi:2-polyprenyl-3-methyl-5-hydroxy-6-metoxy-1,4-benzoquinol methylase